MPFRRIEVPSLGWQLSNLMAAPSSAAPETHKDGLDAYHRLGGNCFHLHGEGGETHSREAIGRWLRHRSLRTRSFVCTQICHDAWDDQRQCPIDRFTAEAVAEDVAADLDLLGTHYLDLVYLDDTPDMPVEPVLEALGREAAIGRIRAVGVRNWAPERILAAIDHTTRAGVKGISMVVTTELSLATPTQPLWPEYLPFDQAMRETVRAQNLGVFAHVSDFNTGQCLFGNEVPVARARPEWVQRWSTSANRKLAKRVRVLAEARGLSPRTLTVASILCHSFPVIGIVPLPSLLTAQSAEYERASAVVFSEADRSALCEV